MAKHKLSDAQFRRQERVAFFKTLYQGFQRAADACGLVEHSVQISQYNLRLRFAGGGLIPCIMPALRHIADAANHAPQLTIHIFDSESTNTALPLWPASLVNSLEHMWSTLLGQRREIKAYTDERFFAVYYPGESILCLLDRDSNQAIYWVQNASRFPYWEKAYPLASLLNAWLSQRQHYFVHAAALGTTRGGILLSNKGGSGKSTTTVASVLSGLSMLGDDYCAVVQEGERIVAHTLYNSIKIEPKGNIIRYFPQLRPHIVNWDGFHAGSEKAVVFMHQTFPQQITRKMPVRAILVPHISGNPQTVIKPLSRGAALRALAPNTMLQLAGNSQTAFRWLGQLVRRLPSYQLALGTEIDQIPDVLRKFLAQHGGVSAE